MPVPVRTARHMGRTLAEAYPDAATELDFTTPLELLVATVLSAQSTDQRVNAVTPALFARYPDAAAYAAADRAELESLIATVGLYRSKAASIQGLAQAICDDHGGEVPRTMEELVALPGVGRKTANVVLNCWFGQETFAVDTHIFRVGNRTGLAKGKTPDHVEAKLEKRVPQPFRLGAHHWLILHGRYVCKARTPECWRCKVVDLCSYRKKVLEKPVRSSAKG